MKFGSASAWFLVDGYRLTASKVKSLLYRNSAANEDSTGIGDTVVEKTPTGMSDVVFEQNGGFFDTSANGAHAALSAPETSPQGTPRIVCLGFAGQSIGAPFIGLQGMFQMAYEVLAQVGQLTKANAQYQAHGQVDYGSIVQPLETKTEDWNTKTLGTVVDYTDDPSNLAIPVTSSSEADPSVITTAAPHGFATGQIVLIEGHEDSTPDINGEQTITVLTATTFEVDGVEVTVGGTGGTVKAANTLDGGVGYQQIVALDGFTGFVGKLRDSADDTTYADLITFGNVTAAPDVERATVSGTIDRYVCYDGNVTGTGEIVPFAGLARN